MSLLVIGANGGVGSKLVKQLKRSGRFYSWCT